MTTQKTEKPLRRQNGTELLATAEAEGVAIAAGATNKVMVAAIEAARAARAASDGAPEFVQARRREDGVYLHGEGDLPLNHRLRAEALAVAGLEEDPEGLISEELIAGTAERLAVEAAVAAAITDGALADISTATSSDPPPPPAPAPDEGKADQ